MEDITIWERFPLYLYVRCGSKVIGILLWSEWKLKLYRALWLNISKKVHVLTPMLQLVLRL